MVLLPMDVYRNLLDADGQHELHHHTSANDDTPLQLQKHHPKKCKGEGEVGYKRMANRLMGGNAKSERKHQVVRRLLKSMRKSQLSAIAKNGKPRREN